MEERVKRLEADMSDVKRTLTDFRVESAKGFGDLKSTLSTIDEQLKHVPTRWEAFMIFVAVLAVAGGIVALTARFLP